MRMVRWSGSAGWIAAIVTLIGGAGCDGSDEVDDETGLALLATTSAEYKLPATVDPEVLDDRFTELWAAVYRPAVLHPHKRYPLLVFLHGNHQTCGTGSNPRQDFDITYTTTGTCPDGFVVVPNHAGYEYVATELAARGYIVVSINANRGINFGAGIPGDAGLNLARGRLILKHLSQLSRWNQGLDATPASLGFSFEDHLNFRHVGLMGHSRGGEGVRAAFQQFRDPGSPWPARIPDQLRIEAMFEIAPVDGQTDRVLDANDIPWAVLLPMCDGDVSDLEGVLPFDRMMYTLQEHPPHFKATWTVWGANHNYYNTEWQESDSFGCTGHDPLFTSGPGITGSADQRETGRIPLRRFFRATVGPAEIPALGRLFDPLFEVPDALTSVTRIDRGFSPSADQDVTLRLEDFVNATGTSTFGLPNDHNNITITHQSIPEHDVALRGARISWTAAGAGTSFQSNFTAAGTGISLRRFATLDLRVDRAPDALNPATPTEFSVQLVNANGSLSQPQAIADFLDLSGPVGGPFNFHEMLQTARIPLHRFVGAHLGAIRGVRLVFDGTASGALYVANIRASRVVDLENHMVHRPPHHRPPHHGGSPGGHHQGGHCAVVHVRRASPSAAVALAAPAQAWYEIELRSDLPFVGPNALLILDIGAMPITLSHYPDPHDLGRIVFSLTEDQLARVRDGAPVTIRRDGGSAPPQWQFGPFDRARFVKP